MGKTYRSGHSFPTSAGFTGSSGKVASISPYTRRVPRPTKQVGPVLSTSPKGLFARSAPPMKGPPKPKPMLSAPVQAIDPGSMLQSGRSRKITTQDIQTGGSSPLRAGYKKGGRVKC